MTGAAESQKKKMCQIIETTLMDFKVQQQLKWIEHVIREEKIILSSR